MSIKPLKPDIKSQSQEELFAQFKAWGEPAYRVDQLLNWLYARRAVSWDQMTNLPKPLRHRLSDQFTLNTLHLARSQGSRDTTQKFLWKLPDGAFIESVLIPANPALYGEACDRHTLCVSTQVGCAYGCGFCASGLDGWKRNLFPEEIIEQVLAVERLAAVPSAAASGAPATNASAPVEVDSEPGTRLAIPADLAPASIPSARPAPASGRVVSNLVIMGMGEPLANYEHLMKALHILNAPWGGGIGARKITISTSGLVPQILRLADEPLQFRLAISLHGATDEVRSKIMPINRKYPLRELTSGCEYYQQKKGRMITLEYILIAGVNDSITQAKPLADLARRLHAKINLIPYNKVEGLPWERPTDAAQDQFLDAVSRHDVTVTLRREKGHDIDAACGQLRLKTERELNPL